MTTPVRRRRRRRQSPPNPCTSCAARPRRASAGARTSCPTLAPFRVACPWLCGRLAETATRRSSWPARPSPWLWSQPTPRTRPSAPCARASCAGCGRGMAGRLVAADGGARCQRAAQRLCHTSTRFRLHRSTTCGVGRRLTPATRSRRWCLRPRRPGRVATARAALRRSPPASEPQCPHQTRSGFRLGVKGGLALGMARR